MRILVIGSEGNVGRALIPCLKKNLHEIYRVDLWSRYSNDYIKGDINVPSDFEVIFRKFEPEVVYNLAAMVGRGVCERSPDLTLMTNVMGATNIARLCRIYNSRLIHFSTSEVYGNIDGEMAECRENLFPNNWYGLTKYMGEKAIMYQIKKFGLNAIIVRPCMLYSENEDIGVHRSAMIYFAESLVQKQKVTVHKDSVRGWLHYDDAVKAFENLIYTNTSIINIGHPFCTTIEYVANYMCHLLDLDRKKYIRMELQPKGMTLIKKPSLIKQEKLLGFFPSIDLETGIERVINKMKERIND